MKLGYSNVFVTLQHYQCNLIRRLIKILRKEISNQFITLTMKTPANNFPLFSRRLFDVDKTVQDGGYEKFELP